MLIVGGDVPFVFWYALTSVGAAAGNLVTGRAMALIGFGAAILCATGPAPLHGRAIRAGPMLLFGGCGAPRPPLAATAAGSQGLTSAARSRMSLRPGRLRFTGS